MAIPKKPRLSIRTKLTLPYIALSILIALAGGYVLTRIVINSVEERFTNQLIESRKLASETMVREEGRLLESLRLISFVEGLPSLLQENDENGIKNLVYPIAYNFDLDAVIILNNKAGFITSIIKSTDSGDFSFSDLKIDFSKFPFIQNVVNQSVEIGGDKFAGIIYSDLGNYFSISGPVHNDSGELLGIIIVGKPIQKITDQIFEETLSQATIYNFDTDQSIVSTLIDIPPINDIQISMLLENQESQSMIRNFKSNGIDYTELLGPWEARGGVDIGILGTALPNNFLVNTSNINRINISIFLGISIVISLFLGIFLSGILTKPILALRQATAKVSKGNLSTHVDVLSNDELADLALSFNDMVDSLNLSKENLISAYEKTVEGWAKALELRNADTYGHSTRVTDLTLIVAKKMRIKNDQLVNIRRGALLHDIGKLAIPDSIILKPDALNKKERQIIEQHPIFAKAMLEHIEYLKDAIDIPYYHHEKWDGTGYPRGLIGKEIPLSARIFALVDVYDALGSDRPYRKAWDKERIIKYIIDNSGKYFDPRIVKIFLKVALNNSEKAKLLKIVHPIRKRNKRQN